MLLKSLFQKVGAKLKVVLMPREDQSEALTVLKEWDLWGPLLVCLTLSIMLSITAPDDQKVSKRIVYFYNSFSNLLGPIFKALVFAGVFVLVWIGAAIISVNAQLLGGSISFFQSVCILGYCVFPLNGECTDQNLIMPLVSVSNLSRCRSHFCTVACFVCLVFKALFTSALLVKLAVVVVGFFWSTRASVVFMSQVITPERKALAVYPVFFFYSFIAWMVLIS
jgi:protein YIPF6